MAKYLGIVFTIISLFAARQIHASPTEVASNVQSIGPSVEALLNKSQQADSAQLPNTGAIILSRRGVISVDETGFETAQYYNAIYIKDEEAIKDYTKLTSSFNAYYQEKEVEFARIISPEGVVRNMQEDAISLAAQNNSDDYFDEMKQYEFALPQLKVGSIVEYQVKEQQIKPYIDGQWFSSVDFYFVKFLPSKNWLRIDPVFEAIYTVNVPKSMPFSYVNHQTDVQPKQSNNLDLVTYVWQENLLPGVIIEQDMPSLLDIIPSVDMSSMSNWQTVNRWFNELFIPSQVQSENIKSLAATLFKPEQTNKQKVQTVFNFMQKNIRYIGAHVNRGGYRPHAASEVLEQAYGDCKDQSVLIIALLKQAGIDAFPAMINTYPGAKLNEKLPALNFNHMITYVPLADEVLWLDTSGDTGQFPGIFSNLEDKQAFVVNNEKGLIARLPSSTPQDNSADIDIIFSIVNEEMNVDVNMALTGHIETNLRNYIQFSPEKLTAIEQIFSPLVFNNRVASYETSNPANVKTPFTLSARFENIVQITSAIDSFTYSYDHSAFLKVFTTMTNLPLTSVRKHNFDITLPMSIKVTNHYPAPWQHNEIIVSRPANDSQNAYFETTYQVETTEKLIKTSSNFVMDKQVVAIDRYADFFKTIENFANNAQSQFVFKKALLHEPIASDANSIDEKIAQAKALLDTANFEDALEIAKEITSLDAKNAEAYYLLGLAYGFNGQDSLSEQAFTQAEQLGYQL